MQVRPDTRLDGPPSSWGQTAGDHQLDLGSTEVHQPYKGFPPDYLQDRDLGSDPPKADLYTQGPDNVDLGLPPISQVEAG